jgi:putative NADPH-quinone reductase
VYSDVDRIVKEHVNVSIILGHPATGSFNHAIASEAAEALRKRGARVALHDLYAENFDPVYTSAELARDAVLPAAIEEHCREIGEADGIVIVHPNYWGRPPAMICGWTDRVLRPGRAYRFVPDGKGGARPEGLLKAKHAIIFNTANTPDEKEKSLYGDPLETHWCKVVYGLCSVPNVYRRNFAPVIVSTPEQRTAWLDEVRWTVTKRLV